MPPRTIPPTTCRMRIGARRRLFGWLNMFLHQPAYRKADNGQTPDDLHYSGNIQRHGHAGGPLVGINHLHVSQAAPRTSINRGTWMRKYRAAVIA